jgi:hypothetical protein
MTTPNEEQKTAIEHRGGVLLKAGAGSGKTFVLKEHMIYLVKIWILEYRKTNSIESFDSFIKSKFRKIVLMTFTNKAAGELEIRLQKEFESEMQSQTNDAQIWITVVENLSYLNVSTIHGFCLKLIKQGLIKGVSAEQKMLSDNDYQKQIELIFEDWIDLNIDESSEIYSILLKDKKSLLAALKKIFSDPSLRAEWIGIETNAIDQSGVDEVCVDLFKFLGLEEVFEDLPDLSLYQDLNDKKWFKFLEVILPVLKENSLSLESIIKVDKILNELSYKIPVKPSAKNTPEHLIEYYEVVKRIKD